VGPEPVVAVCTNRSPAEVAESLAALAEQVPAGRLALVTSGLSAAAASEHNIKTVPGCVFRFEPRPGLSLARNNALEWAAEVGAGVIAYVDDDAVVGPGWWEALRQAWEAADERVAVIGGRIRPRWSSPPPEWVSEPILPTLTLLDLGDERQLLDPQQTTVFGANISFAVAPLRELGGFDPAYGHSGRRVFFSEEDQAQRALAARGYGVVYEPALEVEHVIPAQRLTRRSFVRRRFAYGRALGMRDGRGAGLALRQVATSAPGALVALASRDPQRFMERAVRAAENAGVLAGRVRRRAA
jgi:glycosyltransferase involved in cell wall biosynthesis